MEGEREAALSSFDVQPGERLTFGISDEPFTVVIEELSYETDILSSMFRGENHELEPSQAGCPAQ